MSVTHEPLTFIKGEMYMYTYTIHSDIPISNETVIKETGTYIGRDMNTNYLIFSVEVNGSLSFTIRYIDEVNVIRSTNCYPKAWALDTTIRSTTELSYRLNIEMIETYILHSPSYIPPTLENVNTYTFSVGYITLCDFQIEYYRSQNIILSPRTIKGTFFNSSKINTLQKQFIF
jgi:hypothetical protein